MRISDWSSDVCSSDLHLSPVDAVQDDPVAIAERLTGTPYLWGGRSSDGLDCSGMVQLCFSLCGIALPRDTDQQMTARGKDIPAGESLRRGDIIFFPGHVGLMTDHENIVHANAFWMQELGRASCRERVCQYVEIPVVAVYLKKKKQHR